MSQPVDSQPQPQQNPPPDKGRTHKGTKKQVCRFYAAKSGCRAGDACPFLHTSPKPGTSKGADSVQLPVRARQDEAAAETASPPPSQQRTERKFQPPLVDRSRVVSKPVPRTAVEDPREFQVGQIKRRFNPKEDVVQDGTSFSFKMQPSDPDFPYDIEFLECILQVPTSYPQSGKPKLRVTNKEMKRGFQLNVENGFDEIAASAPSATLLGLMNRLDKDLANLLSRQMADTIKIYRNAGVQQQFQSTKEPEASVPQPKPTPSVPILQQPKPSASQIAQAQTKRQADVRQLVARLGKLSSFHQASDGVTFTVPFDPPRKSDVPESLISAKTLRLVIPELYNIQPCRVEFLGSKDMAARNVEQAFEQRAKSNPDLTCLAHINYMSQHLRAMAASKVEEKPAPPLAASTGAADDALNDMATAPSKSTPSKATDDEDNDSHIHHIPRPPEWGNGAAEDDSHGEDSDTYDSGDETDEDDEEPEHEQPVAMSIPAERGIMLSFPQMELYGIELLELISLSVTVKCERCKELLDVERLRNNTTGDHTGMKDESCRKCANPIAVGYRMDLMHTNSVRAGYLDLDGCTVVDMLPSTFVPTCSECSTSYTTPGCVSVRGESTLAVCRECHRKMTFRIPEVKFLLVSAASERASRAPVKRKVKEKLGIVAGQELPKRGRCTHYNKSYRWFRFSCCSKVFACDKCHDTASDHPNEHANRMICGFCSREQNYRPEDCAVCHSSLIGRRGHGFWEGGKGTRDQARMSRKDPRKYKRRPGAKPKAQWVEMK